MRGVCPNYFEDDTTITPDEYDIKNSPHFRKAVQVSPQPVRFDCQRGAWHTGVDQVSSEARLSYCAGRDCDETLDLEECCVLYDEYWTFSETVPLAEAGVNLTAMNISESSRNGTNATTTFVSTLAVKRFYYCDDTFTPEYYLDAHQAWLACNEYGVYCHGYQFDPTFLHYRANYTEHKNYSVLLSVPAEEIPPAALLSNATRTNPVKHLPAEAPSVSFTVHCAKVGARFAERNLTTGETVYYEDDEYATVWLKENRGIDTSKKTAEDLGAVHPKEEEDKGHAAGKFTGSSNLRLRMILPASART
eukprot:g14038.t1